MTLQREELEQWLREDRLVEGQSWYLVSTEWWAAAFPSTNESNDSNANIAVANTSNDLQNANTNTAGDDGDVDMDGSSDKKGGMVTVRNAPLVDEANSTRRSVVLRPRLAEERDYRLVSQRVWSRLSHEFGFDWEIERLVVAVGDSHKLRVDVYPTLFKLLYWRSGMDEPSLVEEKEGDAAAKPFTLVVGENTSVLEITSEIQRALLPRLKEFFPDLSIDDVNKEMQVSYRVTDNAPWTPLEAAIERLMDEATTTLANLELEPRDYKDGDERFHYLLVESRFRPVPADGDDMDMSTKDWRVGRFYSDILSNLWRMQLQPGQLVDAVDTDKKWYESRVIEVEADRVKVHFRGWTAKWDEWLDRMSDRLAPLHTQVPNWRAFSVGDDVQVGAPIPGRSYPEWRNATVIKVERVEGDEENEQTLRILVKDGMREKWMDAQDEMLCRPGTHKAVNAAPTTSTSVITARPSYVKSRDYSYDYGRGKPDYPGVVGLQNLGNTCFMNSMLQCLNNAKPLKDYFLATNSSDGQPLFEKDVNEDNPLGMKGRIAREFAKLVKRMWSGEYATVSPTGLKSVIGEYAPQFAGYQQQDSQEVMNFILDGLHEDLNRVKKKPYTTPVERNGRGDDEVAQEEWAQYLRRNDSVIVENFMGQLRSHVTCSNPECANESTTFDPFMSLSVPIPSDESVPVKVQLFWANGSIPMKYAVRVEKTAVIRDVKKKLSELCGVPDARLFFVEVRGHRIKKVLRDATAIDDLNDDILHVYELEFPVSEYECCSSNLRPLTASFANGSLVKKSMRLVALLHQAPVASPVDARMEPSDMLQDEGFSQKHRRVEVELFNTPLLVSIEAGFTNEQIHDKVWRVVARLVADDSSYDDKTLPYRLHVTNPNGAGQLIGDFPRTPEPANLPNTSEVDYCFTLEWSRKGYQQGYDEKSAKRIELHESMHKLRISSSSSTDDVTLDNCITKFMEREQLGKTDTWYCPKCKEHVRAFKKFDLFSLPKVLIFQLKRFRYAQSSFSMYRDKISTLVSFPIEELDMGPYVVGPQRVGELKYDLFAVSEHSGGLGGGHYTAVGKNPENGKWYNYNDSFTKSASAQDAITSRAYVLFYVRRE